MVQQTTLDMTVRAELMAERIAARAAQPDLREMVLNVWSLIKRDCHVEQVMDEVKATLTRGEPYWDICCVLAAYAELCRPDRYLEIGVRQGRSAAVVAAIHPEVELFLFDMWYPDYAGVPNPGPNFVREQLQAVGHCGQVHFVTGRSQETVPAFFAAESQSRQMQLITVDGDHRDEGAMRDLQNVADHLAPGGMLVFDDITHPKYPTLHQTWKTFLAAHSNWSIRENVRDGTGTAIAIKPG